LQTTLQCCNINEARFIYDQLAVISPILFAMSAGAPIFGGYLADIDCRWTVIAQSVDDRTLEERGMEPLKNNKFKINKSRYDSIDCFISSDPRNKKEYNDIDLVFDKDVYKELTESGVDELLARHVSHLWIRDPLVIYDNKVEIDDKLNSDHFENIQSTNWQTVRFKPPPPGSPIGWRVEFRPLEIQLSDFENAAFVVFVILLTRLFSDFDYDFYMPISLVDQNLKVAHKRDAVNQEKFYFRRSFAKSGSKDVEMFSVNELMNGNSQRNFCGLIPIVNIYLDSINVPKDIRSNLNKYLTFLSKKASGEILTTASYIRKFVDNHPDYKHDSVITQKINYDLIKMAHDVGSGTLRPYELFGNLFNV